LPLPSTVAKFQIVAKTPGEIIPGGIYLFRCAKFYRPSYNTRFHHV